MRFSPFRAVEGMVFSIAVVFGLMSCGSKPAAKDQAAEEKIQVPPPSIPRSPAPNFEWKDIDGNLISSAQLQGVWTVVHIWTTWSPQSVKEVSELVQLQNKFGKGDLHVLGISLDEKEDDVRSFLKKNEINYPIIFMSMDTLEQYFGEIDAIPTTFLISPKWELANRHTGYVGGRLLAAELESLSSEKQNEPTKKE
jgi:peroxiredoxin